MSAKPCNLCPSNGAKAPLIPPYSPRAHIPPAEWGGAPFPLSSLPSPWSLGESLLSRPTSRDIDRTPSRSRGRSHAASTLTIKASGADIDARAAAWGRGALFRGVKRRVLSAEAAACASSGISRCAGRSSSTR